MGEATTGSGDATGGALEGRTLRGGPASVDRLAWLLGLDRAPGLHVAAASWVRNRVEVTVVTSDARKVVVHLERPTPGRAAFKVLATLVIAHAGDFLPEEMRRRLAEVAPSRLAGLAADDLGAGIADDPAVRDLTPKRHGGKRQVAALLDTWGGEDAYAEFFAGSEMRRAQLDSIDPGKLFDFIQHSDNECGLVSPHGVAPTVSMVDYPWDNRVRHLDEPAAGPRRDGGAVEPGDEGLLSTNLTERDVIQGNPDKVREVLDYAVRKCGREGKPLLFSNTCVPTVNGEDVESVVRQYARQHEVPLLFLAMSPKSMHDVFRDLLVDRRKRFEAEAGPPDPRAVNLIGFPDERATREVADLLACLGVRVKCLLLPDLDLDRFRRLPEASLNVCLPNAVWKHHYDHLQRDSRTPAISPAGPFGRAGTRRWAVEVAKALGLDVDVDAAWAAYAARYDGEWTVAAARCAGKRLGLVVRGVDTRYLADPAETWGIPIVAMMEEAGFGLDVLLKVDDRDEARTRAGIVQGLFRDPARHALKGFNSFELMRQRLREAPCRAVFSQHVFDWRLTEAGKGRFSLQHFEMGLPGAIRTAARLASIAESPFFAAYGKYLGRTPEGLRLPVGGGS